MQSGDTIAIENLVEVQLRERSSETAVKELGCGEMTMGDQIGCIQVRIHFEK